MIWSCKNSDCMVLYTAAKGGNEMSSGFSGCESCSHYVYNEEYECYECLVNLDEDETARFLSGTLESCPYYSNDDEYRIVRRQM